ncbi:hypothetical protein PIB30_029997 [Stylosanthes scabra]|uniref:AMP-dependent synthetase/ligase domain-containing protein n=1 Tax=Stylosanthes scabra TaxID=79078 RepID=A0ABU6QAV6_9FABA|nr:hypothetical protein [Stylosanthes scabra]
MFPWVELRQGYGLTESSAAATFFASDRDSKARPDSCGQLVPTFYAKVVDIDSGKPLPPHKKGELWLKSPTIMKEYLGNSEATTATVDSDGWLKTGDLSYIDEGGFVYVVERIKELIKHNGYQVAPAELESLLLSHPLIVDAAVIPCVSLSTTSLSFSLTCEFLMYKSSVAGLKMKQLDRYQWPML